MNQPFKGADHPGVDYAAPLGTRTSAAEAGTVGYAGWLGKNPNSSAGNTVIVQSQSPYVNSFYYHLSRISVAAGQNVAAGSLVGLSGNTGTVKGQNGGYHLHFEQRPGGPIFGPNGFPAGQPMAPCR
ncbi:MAG: M23 family metallopeptidase [Bryobacteraceae bacterium]